MVLSSITGRTLKTFHLVHLQTIPMLFKRKTDTIPANELGLHIMKLYYFPLVGNKRKTRAFCSHNNANVVTAIGESSMYSSRCVEHYTLSSELRRT